MANKNSIRERWLELDASVKNNVPQLYSVLTDEVDFIELRLKIRDDRTVLGILKRYGSDGAPMVCFGSGYGVTGALVGLEGTIAAGKWRLDKPWNPDGNIGHE